MRIEVGDWVVIRGSPTGHVYLVYSVLHNGRVLLAPALPVEVDVNLLKIVRKNNKPGNEKQTSQQRSTESAGKT